MHTRSSNAFVSVLSALLLAATAASAIVNNSDGPNANAGIDQGTALVQLVGDPLSTSSKTKPPPGKKIDFSSDSVKAYRAQLSAQRNDFKAWLKANAPAANVTGEFDISLNAVSVKLNGTTLATLSSAPMVQRVEFEGLYSPAAKPSSGSNTDPDLSLISALDAWNTVGGVANAGAGVKVGIIDTGIDITHPCFSDAGYPAQQQLGDQKLTNNKVIAAKVFYNKAAVQGLTARAIQEHGTHVAGTVACNFQTPAVLD